MAQDKSFTQGVERTAGTAPVGSTSLNTLPGILHLPRGLLRLQTQALCAISAALGSFGFPII
jgi:hypothetical protein